MTTAIEMPSARADELATSPTAASLTPRRPTDWGFGPDDELAPGRRVLKRLGGGDRYEAYIVWEDRLMLPVVAKVLRPHLRGEVKSRKAMAGEVAALDALAHPVLVRGFGAELDSSAPHILLELLDGPRLSTLVRKYGPLSAEQVVLLARQITAALHYLGATDWVHLDVKPQNIIMTASPRLIDLSVARPVALARRTTGVGTAAYMAPEQIDPRRTAQIGPAADVFGLGATLYEALTGRKAFPARPGVEHPQLDPERPALPPKTPDVLASLLTGALADDPHDRPTAAEFYDALDDLVAWAGRNARRIR